MTSIFKFSASVASRSVSRPLSTRNLFTSSYNLSAVKPGSDSEATVPGGGSVSSTSFNESFRREGEPDTHFKSFPYLQFSKTEDVAHSEGAYSKQSNPDKSGSQIQQEKGDRVDMKQSAATSEASNAATKGGQSGPGSKSTRDEPISNQLPPGSGKSE